MALSRWMSDVDRFAPGEVVKVVVGLKYDAVGATSVAEADAVAFAQKHGALCERCSAKAGTGIFELFEHLGAKLVHNGFDPDGLSSSAKQRKSKSGLPGGKKQKKGETPDVPPVRKETPSVQFSVRTNRK